jgi:hypothetical protein
MNKRIKELISQSYEYSTITTIDPFTQEVVTDYIDCTKPIFNKEKFAELIVKECINREELLGAIARGWCSEKNSHKTMDPDLALAIFDEVERQIKQHFGVE